MKNNILFDLDGTLTDPQNGITRSIQHALKEMGRPVPVQEELLWCIGPPLREDFRILLQTDETSLIEQAVAIFRERYGKKGMYENNLYPGIPELLSKLNHIGKNIYLATSKMEEFAKGILEHFDLAKYFSGIHGEQPAHTQGKAKIIQTVLETHQLQPQQTVMIGDRKHDILGGKENGVATIAVSYGYGSQEELRAAKPDCLCPDILSLERELLSSKNIASV